MKMMVLRQLQQAAPGLLNRRRPATTLLTGTRGMTTGEDIMCGSSEPQPEKRTSSTSTRNAGVAAVECSSSSSAGAGGPAVVMERVVEVVAVAKGKQGKWWRPDPKTGTWVPDGYEGQVTTTTDVMKAASRVMRIRSDTTASLEDKRWWTSMEELPDMDRANPPASSSST